MRRLAILLLLLGTQVLADDHVVVSTEVHCFKKDILYRQLRDQFEEQPVFIGKSHLEEEVSTILYVNQQTGTYTLVQTGNGIACILDTGNNMRYRIPRALENKLL
jgi:hypothetical protein